MAETEAELKKLTVNVLKEKLTAAGLKTTGIKAVLVARLLEHNAEAAADEDVDSEPAEKAVADSADDAASGEAILTEENSDMPVTTVSESTSSEATSRGEKRSRDEESEVETEQGGSGETATSDDTSDLAKRAKISAPDPSTTTTEVVKPVASATGTLRAPPPLLKSVASAASTTAAGTKPQAGASLLTAPKFEIPRVPNKLGGADKPGSVASRKSLAAPIQAKLDKAVADGVLSKGELDSDALAALAALPEASGMEAVNKFTEAVSDKSRPVRNKNGFLSGIVRRLHPADYNPDAHQQALKQLPMSAQRKIQAMYATGQLKAGDYDPKVLTELAKLGEAGANTCIERFSASDLVSVRSKTAFMIGIIRRLQREAATKPSNGGFPSHSVRPPMGGMGGSPGYLPAPGAAVPGAMPPRGFVSQTTQWREPGGGRGHSQPSPRGGQQQVNPRGGRQQLAPRGTLQQPAPRGGIPHSAPRGGFQQTASRGGIQQAASRGGLQQAAPRGLQHASPRGGLQQPAPRGGQQPAWPRPASQAGGSQTSSPSGWGQQSAASPVRPPTGSYGGAPAYSTAPSVSGYGQPTASPGYGQPKASPGYGQPTASPGYGQPTASPGYGQPTASPGYGQPAASPGYGQSTASSGYGQPAASSGYGQPAASPGYGQPAASTSYGKPATQVYGQPSAAQGYRQTTATSNYRQSGGY